MTYLYGDSTDSGLQLNYIELLREFLDFAVQVMLSEHRISGARAAHEDRKRAASAELDRLRGLGATVASALAKAKGPNPKSSTDQSIAALHRATEDTLRRAAEGIKVTVAQAEQELATSRSRERAANAKLIEVLLLNHELPDSQNTVAIRLNAEGSGYEADVLGSCAQGLSWRFQAQITKGTRFDELIKVGSLRPELSIDLPEMSGFVRKSVKLKPHKLSSLFVTNLAHEGQAIVLKLRSSTQSEDLSGLDIRFSPTSPKCTITRTQKGEESPVFQVPENDAEVLSALCKELVVDAASLVNERRKLLEVSFNEIPLRDCPDPTVLVERLVKRIGPTIQSIAAHSLADTELVLKRVLANDRREEIFASKVDLLDRLRTVPPELRDIFAPLGLGDMQSDIGDHDTTNRVDASSVYRANSFASEVITSAPTVHAPATPSSGKTGYTEVDAFEEPVAAPQPPSTLRKTRDESALVLAMVEEEVEEATHVAKDSGAHEITADAADELPPPSKIPRPPTLPARARTPNKSVAPPIAVKPPAKPRSARVSKAPPPPPPPSPTPPAPQANQAEVSLDSIDVALAELESDS